MSVGCIFRIFLFNIEQKNIISVIIFFFHSFDANVSAALSFLAAICQRPQYAPHFLSEGLLREICNSVVVKNMMLRAEDLQMYENEPFEFLKRDIEGLPPLHTSDYQPFAFQAPTSKLGGAAPPIWCELSADNSNLKCAPFSQKQLKNF